MAISAKNRAAIANFNRWVESNETNLIQSLRYIGEESINKAREKKPEQGSFNDQTGNLRSSMGYVVSKNGEVVDMNVEGQEREGIDKATSFARELVAKFNKGYVLILFAGMEYALYVEAKNYDVITGSVPSKAYVLKTLEELL